jgi:hypothetical protein
MTAALIFSIAALLCPPCNEELLLSNPFARLGDRWRTQSSTRRGLLTCVAALAFGLFLLPWLIWIAGQAFLGPYANGGAWAFLTDFFLGLAHGSLAFWVVALGPLLSLLLIRFSLHRGQ